MSLPKIGQKFETMDDCNNIRYNRDSEKNNIQIQRREVSDFWLEL